MNTVAVDESATENGYLIRELHACKPFPLLGLLLWHGTWLLRIHVLRQGGLAALLVSPPAYVWFLVWRSFLFFPSCAQRGHPARNASAPAEVFVRG